MYTRRFKLGITSKMIGGNESKSAYSFSFARKLGRLRDTCYVKKRSGYSYGTRSAACICCSYGSQKISVNFSVITDSSLFKLLYLP